MIKNATYNKTYIYTVITKRLLETCTTFIRVKFTCIHIFPKPHLISIKLIICI